MPKSFSARVIDASLIGHVLLDDFQCCARVPELHLEPYDCGFVKFSSAQEGVALIVSRRRHLIGNLLAVRDYSVLCWQFHQHKPLSLGVEARTRNIDTHQ